MPIYEYVCEACGERFDKLFRSMSGSEETPAVECPACHTLRTRRIVSSFGLAGGPAGPDPQQIAAERSSAQRQASVTPLEQINTWRRAKKSG